MTARPASRPHGTGPRLQPLAAAVLSLFCAAATAQVPAVLPTGLQVRAGQASTELTAQGLTVRNSPNAILDWQRFDIGAGQRVYFEQASSASKVLNRVVGGGGASQILGQLGSNGQVWLLNPQGLLFGTGAQVDVHSLVASSLALADADFLAGRFRFEPALASGSATGGVRNEGRLRGSLGGQVSLLSAERVDNAGRIEAGQINLAAGTQIELVDGAAPNLAVRVSAPAGEALNLGELLAPGGLVDVHAATVNQQGLIRATELGVDAQGRVVLRATQALNMRAGSRTEADGQQAAGRIELDAGAAGTMMQQGALSATSGDGVGGRITLLGRHIGLLDGSQAHVDGASGGGDLLVGGGAMGKDAALRNGEAVFMAPGAQLSANATGDRGNGGRIVLWSDQATRAYGSFSAQGGQLAGDGGLVETSGGWLDARPIALALHAKNGAPGGWLLDPFSIYVGDNFPDTQISSAPNFVAIGGGSRIRTSTIAAALNAGNSVTISTGDSWSGGNEPGDIFFTSDLSVAPPAPVSLTLKSARNTDISSSTIRSTAAALSLRVEAAGGSSQGLVSIRNSNIHTRGGEVVLGAAQPSQATKADGSLTPSARFAQGGANDHGVQVQDSILDLGVGSFYAYGNAGAAGVSLYGTQLLARDVEIRGHAANGAHGVGVLNGSQITASNSLSLEGSGGYGVLVGGRSRLQLNGPGTLRLVGQGKSHGVAIWDESLAGNGGSTPIWVIGGQLDIQGEGLGDAAAVNITGSFGTGIPIAPSLDLGLATAAVISAKGAGERGLQLSQVSIKGPSTGGGLFIRNESTSTNPEAGRTSLSQVRLAQSGAGANIEGLLVAIDRSALQTDRLYVLSRGGPQLDKTVIAIQGSQLDIGSGSLFIGGSNGSTPTGSGLGRGVHLMDSQLSANSPIHVQGQAESQVGIELTRSTLSANGGDLELRGTTSGASIPGIGINGGGLASTGILRVIGDAPDTAVHLRGNASLQGGAVLLAGDGALLLEAGAAGRLQAASADVVLDTNKGISINGDWLLTSPTSQHVKLKAATGISLAAANGAVPRFDTGKLELRVPGGMTVGGSGANVLADDWARSLATLPATSETVFWSDAANATLRMGAVVSTPGKLQLEAARVELATGAQLSARGAGDAIMIDATTFINLAVGQPLATPNGRWGMALASATGHQFGSLVPEWSQYGSWNYAQDAQGNYLTPNPGNAVFIRPTIASLTGTDKLSVHVSKLDDGSSTVALNAGAPGSLVQVSGLLPGHQLVFDGSGQGSFADALVGAAKTVALATGVSARVLDANGKPVLGYPVPTLTGEIRPNQARSAGNSEAPAAQGQRAMAAGLGVLVPISDASTPAEGRTLDASSGFGAVAWAQLPRPEQEALLAARTAVKQQALAPGMAQLLMAPDAPLLRNCRSADELDSGACLITDSLKAEMREARDAVQWREAGRSRVMKAALPQIGRKLALIVGTNHYQDTRLPQLSGARQDAQALQTVLAQELGYDTVLLHDANRAELVRALNRLAAMAGADDSVLIYYAGHGELNPATGMGYWLPADAQAEAPQTWLANSDIAAVLARINSRQMLLVSDSCYAGSLAGPEAAGAASVEAAQVGALLGRKAAAVLTSGGHEPVADIGRDGHSVFAYHLMQQLRTLPDWRAGGRIFEVVRDAVRAELPQLPQYAAMPGAGHERGADYLLERRQLAR